METSPQSQTRDRVYALPMEKVGRFTFDEDVVEVFPDMIARSVPGYASVLSMIGVLGRRYLQPNSNAYDLGCSLGAGSQLLRDVAPPSTHIYAVDNSKPMIERLRAELLEDQPPRMARIVPTLADLRQLEMRDSTFVMMNWTLQFIPVDERDRLIGRIFDSLRPQGALMLSEKIVASQPAERDLLIDLHHEFKSSNGYSQLEIAQKRNALDESLVPETSECHQERLARAGFKTVAIWFQCFNFASWLAIKA